MMNHYTAIQNLKAPEEFAGKIDWRIVFEIDGCGDETSFDIDCSAPRLAGRIENPLGGFLRG